MSNLPIQTFDFEEAAVRTLIRDEKPWFVARDVCEVLGIKNSRDALSRLDADERNTVALTDGNRGNPNTNIISESGLYTLILRCDDAIKPGTTAHRFRKWVTAEVLPTLRKTGAYELAKQAEHDEQAERLESVRHEVACGLRDVNDMARYAQDDGALRGRMPMSRVRAVQTLGRLRLDALRLLWEMESTGTRGRLINEGTAVLTEGEDEIP